MHARIVVAMGAMVVGLAGPGVLARSYNPDLGAFYRPSATPGQSGTADVSSFKDWAGELGVAMAPRFLGPATTLGSMGYEVSLEVGLATIHGGRDYWKNAASDPGNVLVTNQIRIRKGLPYSLQISGLVTHLFDSDMWGIGLEFGGAVVEGFRYVPDISLQTSIGTLLGAGDLAMLQVGLGLIVSKTFNVAGLFTVAPYAGYHLIYVNAGTYLTAGKVRPADPTATPPAPARVEMFVIDGQNIFRHRAVLGFNVVATYVTAGAEFGLGPGQTTYAFKIGTQF